MSITEKKIMRKKAEIMKDNCVACGTCVGVCPKGAIKVIAGVFAEVDREKCIGCAKCSQECPASVIIMV